MNAGRIATVVPVAEDAATGKVAAIYEDIRRTKNLPAVKVDIGTLEERDHIRRGQYEQDKTEYRVLSVGENEEYVVDGTKVPAGRYLVADDGKIVYRADPAINGALKEDDQGNRETLKFDAPKTRLMQLIIDQRGASAWERVARAAHFQDAHFNKMQSYPDALTYDLAGCASSELGIPLDELLRELGKYWVPYTHTQGYAHFFEVAGPSLRDFLLSLDELHAFANRMDIPRRAFQGDHYDLPESYREEAISAGAVAVPSRELVRRLRAAGLRLTPDERRRRSR